MSKKNLTATIICTLIFFATSLDGFNAKFNKFSSFYFINEKLDWGNLYVEGVEIDFKAAVLAQRRLRGGYFDEHIHSVIPNDFNKTDMEWKRIKDQIAYLIGPIPYSSPRESASWKNSTKDVDSLLDDARRMSFIFKNDFQSIALQTQTTVHFGSENQFIVKSKESLMKKVKRDAKALNISQEEAIEKIGDALRGTLIVDDLKTIPLVIAEIIQYVDDIGGKVAFRNLWVEDRKSGYVGVHAKILFPLQNEGKKEGNHYILTEMQIHLDSIVDGSEVSAKERAHSIYENLREDDSPSIQVSAASKLLFLTAMEGVLSKQTSRNAIPHRGD